ncbi:unnamed protein product [Chondrus crispus]|uniref:DDE-1 domain-containing protein n=1 Tax=Chondrus crispus TaxID=2769 RepID=R7Q6H0_CHOCR|nr:unnamed protein product [Chondrus crispus]CDF33433.1 unnamed protein product [Chondrus crispus]|eukprot:XP_005713236.1 unnamed protein product [Chondrus crispus]
MKRSVTFNDERCGRKPVLFTEEEQTIKKAALEFSRNGTPLSRECLKDLVQMFVNSLPLSHQNALPFKDTRTGDSFVRNFLNRHKERSLKRRANLEKPRADAMSPVTMAEHFARLHQVYREYKITSAQQIFNLDESGFSMRTVHRSRTKAVFERTARSNSKELKWSKNAEHATIMPVVSADGRVWCPVAILPGKRSKYRIRADGKKETPSCYLPSNAYTSYRDPAGVDGAIFYDWAQKFVTETTHLRQKHKNIVLTFDGYGAHVSLRALKVLKENNIVVVGLPAHTSHRTQVLDYSVFSSFKTFFRSTLNRRAIGATNECRNDIYTLCEMLHEAYKRSVTYNNIVSGFKACGIWCPTRKDIVPEVINASDITNWQGYESQAAAHRGYQELVDKFKRSKNLLVSDGEVLNSGTINTTSGALLTSEDVLEALQARSDHRAAEEQARNSRAEEACQRRAIRIAQAEATAREKELAAQRKAAHDRWLSQRSSRQRQLDENRIARRQLAKMKVAAMSSVSIVAE